MTLAEPPPRRAAARVHPAIERLGAYSWRLIAIAVVGWGVLWLLGRLWVVVLAVVIALLFTRPLIVPAQWLRDRGVPPALSALLSMLGLALILGGLGWLVYSAAADEFDQLGGTVSQALDDVERWLVEDAPFDISRSQLDDLRAQAGERVSGFLRNSSSTVVSGVVVLFEVLAGLLLALITTFFLLKDGPRFQRAALRAVPEERHHLARAMAARAWATLGGYLRGAAILGLVEAVILGAALWLTGSGLVIPVMIIVVLGAFVPFVGAIVSALIAVLVALATGGFGAALIVAIVALVVQQLDNDLLAPVIYGKALALHPLTVLFAITAGGALFGPAGAILAVPVAAVIVNVASEYREQAGGTAAPGSGARPAP